MNESANSIITWLKHLQVCMPAEHITIVGAGNGKGAWVQWLQTQFKPSTLVEADARQFSALQRLQSSGALAEATLINKVVAVEQGAAEFFTANLAEESGLLAPESLRHLWPNLHTVRAKPVQAMALAQLFQIEQAHQWLMLDCLPAAALLQKAHALLPKLDAVLARVLLTEGDQRAEQPEGASLAELAQALPDFMQLALQPSRHPDIAYVLFVRDYRRAWQNVTQMQIAEAGEKKAVLQVQTQLQNQLQQAQVANADLLQKQEWQEKAQQRLEANLAQVSQGLDTERKAKQAALQTQAQLQSQIQQVQAVNMELLQKQELQAQAQQSLEADLSKSMQAYAAEGKAKQAAIQAQEMSQVQLQQAQRKNTNLLQKNEHQAESLKKLEANLAQWQQDLLTERDARNTAIEQQQQLKTELLKTQKVEAALLEKSVKQEKVHKELELKLAQMQQAQETERITRNTVIEEQQQLKAELRKVQQILANTEKLASQRLAQLSAFELRISQLQALAATESNRDSRQRDALINASAQLKLLKDLLPIELRKFSQDNSFENTNFSENSSVYIKNKVDVKQLDCIDLGKAWAGNTVNTVIFRHHGILTKDEFQYTAFYADEQTLRVVRRQIKNNELHTYDMKGQFNLKDAHNSISLGIDRDNCLHICYDHHATRLRYRRGLNSHDIESWTDELPMTGAYEDKVTYPTFILPRHEFPLTMLYRDGTHNKGSARIKVYDEKDESWRDHPNAILSGADHQPWTSNAYWNHPAVGADGSLHLSFVWRTEMLGEKQLVNNVNIGYAWSPDNGLSWFTSLGQPCKLPMTQVNAETVWPVSPGSNLINQCSMALDSKNRPHIAYYVNDIYEIPQYYHLWFDGRCWHKTQVSQRKNKFLIRGNGTLRIPLSRPEILISFDDHVIFLMRSDETEYRMSISVLRHDENNEIYHLHERDIVIWSSDVAYSEPVIDRERWLIENKLTILLQRCIQENGDGSCEIYESTINLVDFKFD